MHLLHPSKKNHRRRRLRRHRRVVVVISISITIVVNNNNNTLVVTLFPVHYYLYQTLFTNYIYVIWYCYAYIMLKDNCALRKY